MIVNERFYQFFPHQIAFSDRLIQYLVIKRLPFTWIIRPPFLSGHGLNWSLHLRFNEFCQDNLSQLKHKKKSPIVLPIERFKYLFDFIRFLERARQNSLFISHTHTMVHTWAHPSSVSRMGLSSPLVWTHCMPVSLGPSTGEGQSG